MTTHLRARALQAGAFVAVIGGVLVAAPSPASAQAPNVSVTSLSPGEIPSGSTTKLTYRIENPNITAPAESVTVVVNGGGLGCSPAEQCNFTAPINPGGQTFSVTLKAGAVAAGQKKTITVRISAKVGTEPPGGATATVTVRGPDKPQVVRQVSGKVKDQASKAVAGALVGLRDSQGHQYSVNTNGDGGYSFTSSDSKPIAVGTLSVGAAKDGYEIASKTADGRAGKSVNVPLVIKLKAAASPSNSPSPSVSATTEPTDEATTDEPATDESATALDPATKSGDDEGSGSLLYIILGGLLVAAGIGAIVLVLMRRRSSEDPDRAAGAAPGGAVPAAAPATRYGAGVDETRLGAPVGGRTNDATMIAPRSGAPSIADAPTMIHQTGPPVDEFPDPYGAPMPAAGGWGAAGAAAGAYSAAQSAPAYGTATQYGGAPAPAQQGGYADQDDHGYAGNGYGPGQPAAYADQGGGYDQAGYADQGGYEQPAQRFDEPTGMYRPEPNGGYPPEAAYDDQPAYGGYPQGADDYAEPAAPYQGADGYQGGGYGAPAEPVDQAGYGAWDGADGGIDSGNAYGPPAGYGAAQGGGTYGGGAPAYGGAPAGAYGAPAGGGDGEPANGAGNGYGGDPGGYDPRATYGRPEGYGQPPAGGQQQPPGGYRDPYPGNADQNGYYGGPEQPGGRHGGQPQQQAPQGVHPGQRRSNDWIED